MKPVYGGCGSCGHLHPEDFFGDCRDDANRFTNAELDEKYGIDGWEEKPWYENHYRHCGHEWYDEWDCMCNDECPVCGAEIEPYDSIEVEPNP